MKITKLKNICRNIGICLIAISIILVLNFIFANRPILYHFYNVDKLTEIFYEQKSNKRTFNGAVCRDGRISTSQGRGTCSWHGGVRFYFYKGDYIKTKEECRREAKKISWIE